jgi:tRNA-2-methylthio-N6-dimethylallyladenosine synthase
MHDLRVHITTYGCQMNRLDAELAAEALRASGAAVVDDANAANVLLFITCSVRGHAEDRVFSNIGALRGRKQREPGLVIGLLGCMAQQYGEDIRRRAPLVDVVCAPGRLAELPDLLAGARAGQGAVALDPSRRSGSASADFAAADAALDRLEVHRPLGPGGPGQAYVVAMRGCDNFCAYCVVPRARGPERSRPPSAVLDEVRRLVGQGARQVTLLGQAVNQYAAAEAGRRWDLADLLAAVVETPGLARLHFITNHPRAMTPRLAAAFRDVPRVAPYLHMPAQSGADAVLARMKRGYTAAEYEERVAMARETRPDVAVASDFIVGFPGETEADFEATAALCRRMRFSGAFVFKYSPRPGTFAAEHYPDDVPETVKRRRNVALLDLVQAIASEENARAVGTAAEVFVEELSPHPNLDAARRAAPSPHPQLRGRTGGNRIVVFDGPASLVGSLVRVRITASSPLTLFAALDAAAP